MTGPEQGQLLHMPTMGCAVCRGTAFSCTVAQEADGSRGIGVVCLGCRNLSFIPIDFQRSFPDNLVFKIPADARIANRCEGSVSVESRPAQQQQSKVSPAPAPTHPPKVAGWDPRVESMEDYIRRAGSGMTVTEMDS